MKGKLIDFRDEGYAFCLVKTKQERDVWIDLDTPDPMDMTGAIENTRTFWGMSDLEIESGWYFRYDDIEKIIKCNEE